MHHWLCGAWFYDCYIQCVHQCPDHWAVPSYDHYPHSIFLASKNASWWSLMCTVNQFWSSTATSPSVEVMAYSIFLYKRPPYAWSPFQIPETPMDSMVFSPVSQCTAMGCFTLSGKTYSLRPPTKTPLWDWRCTSLFVRCSSLAWQSALAQSWRNC